MDEYALSRITCLHFKRGRTEAKGTCFVKDCEFKRVEIVSALTSVGSIKRVRPANGEKSPTDTELLAT